MSYFNNNQVNKLFPGLDKIMQGYTGSSNSEASVYDHSQPAGPSPSTTQECVLSPVSSSMALFYTIISQLIQEITQGSQNLKIVNQMALFGSQDEHLPSLTIQSAKFKSSSPCEELLTRDCGKPNSLGN
ncbi:hypothetical protein DSO57_1014237 [Entomophthora muscae]|uniref:Uncharacterized protein n=1 Tax=Entomophthora muscae TaxID=34485 RepID=A0ACC2TG30_9FUNG|nr:hypothetical protein DSO57_1014237 [Entomophthora muscae]